MDSVRFRRVTVQQSHCISPHKTENKILMISIRVLLLPTHLPQKSLSSSSSSRTSSESKSTMGLSRKEFNILAASCMLWLRTDDFMDKGVDLSWLSAFPHEKEYLYPPLTFLMPIHPEPKAIDIGGRKYQIVDLKAQMS